MIQLSEEDIRGLVRVVYLSLSKTEEEVLGIFATNTRVSPYDASTRFSYAQCFKVLQTLEQKGLLETYVETSRRNSIKRFYIPSKMGSLVIEHFYRVGDEE